MKAEKWFDFNNYPNIHLSQNVSLVEASSMKSVKHAIEKRKTLKEQIVDSIKEAIATGELSSAIAGMQPNTTVNNKI